MAIFDSEGLDIHYDLEGEGKPIMLVHGFASNANGNWRAPGWISFLIEHGRQVISLDCRGHGKSDSPHESPAYDGEVMSEDVIRLMDHLGLQKVELMGYSMGARISLGLLKNHIGRFNRVILGGMGETVFADRSGRNNDIGDALDGDDGTKVDNPVAKSFREFAQSTGGDLKALAAVMGARKATISPSELSHVDIPVLVVVGDNDDLVGDPAPLVKAIPGSELVILKGKDHLTAVPDPLYKEAVKKFLSSA